MPGCSPPVWLPAEVPPRPGASHAASRLRGGCGWAPGASAKLALPALSTGDPAAQYVGTAAHPVLHAVLGWAASVLETPRNQSEVLGTPPTGARASWGHRPSSARTQGLVAFTLSQARGRTALSRVCECDFVPLFIVYANRREAPPAWRARGRGRPWKGPGNGGGPCAEPDRGPRPPCHPWRPR